MSWPPRRARRRARTFSGRGMLPTWVVRMRSVLVFIPVASCMASPARRATLDERGHRIDVAAPLADPLDPPGNPGFGMLRQDRACPRRIIERHVAASHHVERFVDRKSV